ncbi:MAG: hypothetical protein WD042_00425 [Phycisphaeraceae bacterium]
MTRPATQSWLRWPLLAVATLSALTVVAALITVTLPLPLGVADAREAPVLERRIRDFTMAWLDSADTARYDGFTYSVDMGQLLIYAAQANDRAMYDRLRRWAIDNVILNDPQDPFTRGMVVWRHKPGVAPDASGTTEALRIARGLWLGARAFDQPDDRDLAILIVHAYAGHQWSDQGVWMIRNYFNLGDPTKPGRPGRHYVTNSFLIDYDPDFVAEVARATDDATLREVAQMSYNLVHNAGTPCGLLYDMIQPEVMTLMPGNGGIFSPNDQIQLSNPATIAECSTGGAPDVGRRVLDFALRRRHGLKAYYWGRTGEPQGIKPPGYETYAPLLRLAVKLNDRRAIAAMTPPLLIHARHYADQRYEPRLHAASEILLALRAIGPPPPVPPPATAPAPLPPEEQPWMNADERG